MNIHIKRIYFLVLCLLPILVGCRETTPDIPRETITTTHSLNESGTIVAANSVEVLSPSWGGSKRIIWLIEEGMQVAPGDTVIRFEPSRIKDFLHQNEAELEVKQKAVAGARAQQAANRTRTRNSIAKSRLASEKAMLELKNRRFESTALQQDAELDGRQASINLAQALGDSAAQAKLDSLEVAQASLRLVKQEARVRRYETYLDDLTALAPASGMVVYHRTYTEEGVKSHRAGDEVEQRSTVLEITDTSAMKVRFTVHEKDRWRMAEGQAVEVILDAYDGAVFKGEVENVGRLPLEGEEGQIAHRFEAMAAIEDKDPRLKPGMSARVIIQLEVVGE